MVSEGVIQEFIADINFAVIGYRICYIITKQGQEKNSRNNNTKGNNSGNSSNSRKIVIDQLNQIGDILAEIEILGGASIFRVAIREANKYKENTLAERDPLSLDTGLIEKVIPVNSRSVKSCMYKNRKQRPYLTPTDLNNVSPCGFH